jgi:hypothetical protein
MPNYFYVIGEDPFRFYSKGELPDPDKRNITHPITGLGMTQDHPFGRGETGDWGFGARHVKLGISDSPVERLRQIQAMNPRPLCLDAIRPIKSTETPQGFEAEAHRRFDAYRINGEWFLSHDDIWDWAHENMLFGDIKEILSLTVEQYFYELGYVHAVKDVKNSDITTTHSWLAPFEVSAK